ncbi:hypothetical protein CS063_10950 [Sporanaerobium hydrogeniformans]|uniref:Uncharacterized protein n=1 Tax=Sporanaerobium hydrogeniformans TaxID=3072179 RepID=A0AC61DAQ2_9FIRM|nr:chemotaxis protein CheW [Sporanaerobium hydrogeniformans]PHV70389.1 hypothetical protein CS063_10950 [Sporanaerobium hydrogeniformans]
MENVNFSINLSKEEGQKDKYLLFYLGKGQYMLEIRYIKELIKLQPILSMPGEDSTMKGVINLRGQAIVIKDLHQKLRQEKIPLTHAGCIIIVQVEKKQMGFIADRAVEIIGVEEKNIESFLDSQRNESKEIIRGISIIKDKMSLIIDAKKLVEG